VTPIPHPQPRTETCVHGIPVTGNCPPCGRAVKRCSTCGAPATRQTEREATAEEAAAHHQAMDEWRTTEGLPPMPAGSAYKQAPVMITVLGCDEHDPEGDNP
jgi:hypothetical protein